MKMIKKVLVIKDSVALSIVKSLGLKWKRQITQVKRIPAYIHPFFLIFWFIVQIKYPNLIEKLFISQKQSHRLKLIPFRFQKHIQSLWKKYLHHANLV